VEVIVAVSGRGAAWPGQRAVIGLVIVLGLLAPNRARAGMPIYTLDDLHRSLVATDLTVQRLQTLSFFALALLLFAAFIRWIWNGLRKDFPILPRLSYPRALGLVFLWGLLFVLVLTMISGARELLTPGAWEKVPGGVTYRLARPTEPTEVERRITERSEAIRRLGKALGLFDQGDNELRRRHWPPDLRGIPADFWIVPGTDGARYILVNQPRERDGILLYEPEAVGNDRLVFTDSDGPLWKSSAEIVEEQSLQPADREGVR
jgi:hypothetical protein